MSDQIKKREAFCEECRKDVTFSIINKKIKGSIKEKKYSYLGKIAYCNECNSEIYVPEINDYNLKQLYTEYNKIN